MTTRSLPRLPRAWRRDAADDRLDPRSRAAVTYVLGRVAVALLALISLRIAAGPDADAALTVPLLAHVAFVLTALPVALAVVAADDTTRRRAAWLLVATDVLAYGVYSVLFSSVPGAGSAAPVLVLLAGPLLFGWRGLLVTGVPVGVVASLWPQHDAVGHTTSAWQVWLLVAVFAVPAAAVSGVVRRGSMRLAGAEELFRTAFDDAGSGMALLGSDGHILRANPALHALLGVPDLTGVPLQDHTDDPAAFAAALALLSPQRPASRFDVGLHGAGGTSRWASVVASAICRDGRVQRVLLQAEDVSERRELQDRLSFEATHDSLTGLPNQRVLHERLAEVLAEGRPAAVVFVDLDRFKLVNDSLGHAAGDRLLLVASQRLQACVRPGDLVARLGGDEFVILCSTPVGTPDVDAGAVASRALLALRPPYVSDDGLLSATGSVGVALATPGATVGSVVRDADTAMYAAKSAGGDRAVVFSDQLRREVVRRQELESALRDTLRDGGLGVAYQPVVDDAGRVVAAEALLRFSFKGEPADPAEVVAVAEHSGLVADLGLQVLHRALLDSAGWPASVRLHVNVSAHQLDEGFAAAVGALLVETRSDPSRLCLELTETAVQDDLDGLVARLREIRALGVRLAIDDFGVGHASLTYLARLPVQDLKIDRSFVRGLPDDDGSAAIVAGVVAMARAYGMQVVAEGVETREQDLACVRLGCTRRQGFLHHRPMDRYALDDLWQRQQGPVPAPRDALERLAVLPRRG